MFKQCSSFTVQCSTHGIERVAGDMGLQLNHSKSEIICDDPITRQSMLAAFPEFCVVSQAHATLLCSPIGNSVEGIEDTIRAKTQALAVMGDRLRFLHVHDAFCLLRNAFTLPKILYTLRTAPCFLSPLLQIFDNLQRSLLADIANSSLDANDPAWAQAVLPVWSGGLGVQSASQLVPSAFLASAAGSSELTRRILPPVLQGAPCPSHEVALALWSSGHEEPPPSAPASFLQRSWDSPRVLLAYRNLLETAPDAPARARLLAACAKESGALLQALPVSSLGLCMDREVVRVALGLRLGVTLYHPHAYLHYQAQVDHRGLHRLSCRRSQGRHPPPCCHQ